MNASTEAKFDNLDLDDKLTTITTYVREQEIDCKIVLDAACKETNSQKVSNKAVATIMNNLTATPETPLKRRKTDSGTRVTPNSDKKKSATKPPRPIDIFNSIDEAEFKERLNSTSVDSDDESDEEINDDDKPEAVFSTNINTKIGIMPISTADTYKKLGWDNTCNVINTSDPGRNTNAIRCFTTTANFLAVTLPDDFIQNIKNISNPDKLDFNKI